MKLTYKHTRYASYIGYITQAIINNLSPLLFLTFQRSFGISLEAIGLLIIINFGTQIVVDLLSAFVVDKIGYRKSIVIAHISAVIGLVGLGVFPFIMKNVYFGLLLCTVFSAIGGGLTEVLINPIVDALPGKEKAAALSLLHSFYCWGQVAVILLSTLYFVLFGIEHWYILPLLWALIPLFNIFFFSVVPLCNSTEEGEKTASGKLFSAKIFWILLILMLSAGASEISMSQWASLFAESGLGVSKTLGDLLGPCAFAILMGLARTYYGIKGATIDLKNALLFSSLLCIFSYLLVSFSPWPIVSLVGCALCGLSVGLMWPGSVSLASKEFPQGGTAMFALLALAGDLGASAGPGLVGKISTYVENTALPISVKLFGSDLTSAGLKTGLTITVLFPLLMTAGVILLRRKGSDKK